MLISVYLPTRNRVTLLGKAIDSVFSQTYGNIELIVVNDASSDDTEAFLRRRAEREPRLSYFSNSEQRGPAASRNLAILKSRGTFVTGLDDDDEFLPEHIGALVEYWRLLTSRGLNPSCIYVQDIVRKSDRTTFVTQKRSFVSVDDLFEANHIGTCIFAPRSQFIDAGLFDETLPAWVDLEFYIRLLAKCGRAHLLDMATYLFDVTDRRDRISLQDKKIRDAFEIVSDKHSMGLAHRRKALFLQIFSDYYGIRPSMTDCARLLLLGRSPRGLRRLLRTMIRPIRP